MATGDLYSCIVNLNEKHVSFLIFSEYLCITSKRVLIGSIKINNWGEQ